MGFNGDILTMPFTKIAANGNGDLQRALRTSVKSEIQLVADVDRNGDPADRINIWSKGKPFRDQTIVFASDAARNSARQLANFGLSIPDMGYSSLNSMIANLPGAAWTYLKPRIGKDPLRAIDFDGYAPYATAPISPLQATIEVDSAEGTINAGVGYSRNMPSQAGFLTLDDLRIDGRSINDSFGEYYFGVCLYYSDTIRYASTMADKYKTIQASLDEIGLSVRGVSVPGTGTRTYRAIPFFATVPFNTMPSNYQGSLYALPFAECAFSVTRTQGISITMLMYTLLGSDTIYYQYKYNNPTRAESSGEVAIWALQSYNINDFYGSALLRETRTVPAQSDYTSPIYSITDGITARDILAHCSFAGAELKQGTMRVAQSVTSIIIDADPTDPPTI